MNAEKRKFLFQRQNGKCCWCKTGMILDCDPLSKKYASDEHLVPRAKRKKFDKRSKVSAYRLRLLACRKCNNGRKCEIAPQEMLDLAARLADEWDEFLQRRFEDLVEDYV